jgi:hypothetical protein
MFNGKDKAFNCISILRGLHVLNVGCVENLFE